jgi:hypothetical protein
MEFRAATRVRVSHADGVQHCLCDVIRGGVPGRWGAAAARAEICDQAKYTPVSVPSYPAARAAASRLG